MKRWLRHAAFAGLLLLPACAKKEAASGSDPYVQTTLDLLRLKATIPPGTDTTIVRRKQDSIYALHHTTREEYFRESRDLGNDPAHADAVYKILRDSLKIK